MNRLEEIKLRKTELRELLEDETKEVNLEEIQKEVTELDSEETELTAKVEAEQADTEARKVRKEISDKLQEGKLETKKVKEEIKMEEKKYTVASAEYKSAWAKTLMNLPEDKFTEEEKRALGDAVTTTSTTFVEATAQASGVNNGGLLIPTEVRTDILTLVSEMSPFYRDVRKFAVAGNIDLPYMDESDDAEWYAETTETKNEGIELKEVKLTGHDLAKNVVVTWRLEAMTVDSFIKFITEEMAIKMGKALVNGIIYGNGTNKPVGAIYNLSAVEGEDPIDTIVKSYKTLSSDFRIGAKAYISTNVNIDIVGYKDGNDNYPYLNGVSSTKLVTIEVEPFLNDGDIIVGNPKNYVLNEVEQVSIIREPNAKGRKSTYAGFMVADGKPRPSAFVKGSYVAPPTA